MKEEERERRRSVGEKAKRRINGYLNTFGANSNFVMFVETIQKQLLFERRDESKKLNDAQLQKELSFFLSCDPNFVQLFYKMQPSLDAWKKVRLYFDYYL